MGALDCPVDNVILNLGSGGCYTNLEIAEAANEAFGNVGNLEYKSDTDEGIKDSYMDSSALVLAGYVHRYDFKTAMHDIAAIYKNGV